MKFTKDQQAEIKKLWSEGVYLADISKRLTEMGATTENGLPISNQAISIFCLENGMRRQKYKKPAFDKRKRREEKLALKQNQLSFTTKVEPLVTLASTKNTATAIVKMDLICAVASSSFNDVKKLELIRDLVAR